MPLTPPAADSGPEGGGALLLECGMLSCCSAVAVPAATTCRSRPSQARLLGVRRRSCAVSVGLHDGRLLLQAIMWYLQPAHGLQGPDEPLRDFPHAAVVQFERQVSRVLPQKLRNVSAAAVLGFRTPVGLNTRAATPPVRCLHHFPAPGGSSDQARFCSWVQPLPIEQSHLKVPYIHQRQQAPASGSTEAPPLSLPQHSPRHAPLS
jgi:hypothetical protein